MPGSDTVARSGARRYFFQAVLMAPDALRRAGRWQAPIGGAATALVLCLVERAFARSETPAEPTASAA